ncbi:glycosyltransferase [Vibrio splendidus]|uniref:glycosyltransferase n=1 Tax=Vibrio splendidus TaxID=29497 RepID=UPI001FB401B6|nr:glycosyltransferase [Vibrio splendidus]UOE81406.1 glycosyltransferase [Vibrio splendidus]
MNKILSIFCGAHDGLFFKDVFQFPIKIMEEENATLTYLCTNPIDEALVATVPNLTIHNVGDRELLKSNLSSVKYLVNNAREFDLLIQFHVRDYSLLNALLFTRLNPKGKAIIKADRGNLSLDSQGVLRKGYLRRIYEKLLLSLFKPNQLTISYETDKAQKIAKELLPKTINVIKTYNGHNVSPEQSITPFSEKNNTFLIVGAIGDKRKNHRIIIEAIDKILDENENLLNGWDFKFVGGLANPTFVKDIEQRAKKYKYFNNSVKLLGSKNKAELYEFYDNSKYMILSSLHEGSPLIIPESLRFGNIILSTPVSSVPELIHQCGYISDSFLTNDMKLMIESAIINAPKNAYKSTKAYEWGLHLHWNELDYKPQLKKNMSL